MGNVFFHHPGAHTSIQDLGRPGHRNIGVSPGGAVDQLAARVANWLVGNPDDSPVIECALIGPRIGFSQKISIALTGASAAGIDSWQRVEVEAGSEINLSHLREGNYLYLALSGGLAVPKVLGSTSTDLRVGWGGVNGRLIQKGDLIQICDGLCSTSIGIRRVNYAPWYDVESPVRIISGRDSGYFGSRWLEQTYTISSRSDRMGIRLTPEKPIRNKMNLIESTPVFPGTIQCPPDGSPIVMLADAQTLGGYPQIGHVAAVDLHRIAQARPGKKVRFESITLDKAHQLLRQREKELARLKYALQSSA